MPGSREEHYKLSKNLVVLFEGLKEFLQGQE